MTDFDKTNIAGHEKNKKTGFIINTNNEQFTAIQRAREIKKEYDDMKKKLIFLEKEIQRIEKRIDKWPTRLVSYYAFFK